MKTCKIKAEFCDPGEENMVYQVLTSPNANNRIDITPVNCKLTIKHVESVFADQVEMIDCE